MTQPASDNRELYFLGQAVRAIREESGVGVGELASAAGVDQAQLVALEDGNLDPPVEMLFKLADGLDVCTATLIKRAESLGRQDASEPLTGERDRQRVIQFSVFGRSVRLSISTSLRVYS